MTQTPIANWEQTDVQNEIVRFTENFKLSCRKFVH